MVIGLVLNHRLSHKPILRDIVLVIGLVLNHRLSHKPILRDIVLVIGLVLNDRCSHSWSPLMAQTWSTRLCENLFLHHVNGALSLITHQLLVGHIKAKKIV